MPKLYWEDFNEVYGVLGQLFRNQKVRHIILHVVKLLRFDTIKFKVKEMLDVYTPKQRKKNPPKQKQLDGSGNGVSKKP